MDDRSSSNIKTHPHVWCREKIVILWIHFLILFTWLWYFYALDYFVIDFFYVSIFFFALLSFSPQSNDNNINLNLPLLFSYGAFLNSNFTKSDAQKNTLWREWVRVVVIQNWPFEYKKKKSSGKVDISCQSIQLITDIRWREIHSFFLLSFPSSFLYVVQVHLIKPLWEMKPCGLCVCVCVIVYLWHIISFQSFLNASLCNSIEWLLFQRAFYMLYRVL